MTQWYHLASINHRVALAYVYPTHNGCLVTIDNGAAVFQFESEPAPGNPTKVVFTPVGGDGEVDRSTLGSKVTRWNVTVTSNGTFASQDDE